MTEEIDNRTVMVVEITNMILRHIRSSGTYANLAGHEVDFIAFMSHQGTFLAEVQSIKKNVPMNKIYPEMDSKSKTTLYHVGPLIKHPLRRNTRIPRGRKRVTDYSKFIEAKVTSEIFKSRR
ncbi:MAG TPA: hypothetical protein VL688_12060 [Verrucomicrobiae bacterium]|jgi:hypothetical protein|nr:hypothetical protein [Verrucomicrobiae bacterium]